MDKKKTATKQKRNNQRLRLLSLSLLTLPFFIFFIIIVPRKLWGWWVKGFTWYYWESRSRCTQICTSWQKFPTTLVFFPTKLPSTPFLSFSLDLCSFSLLYYQLYKVSSPTLFTVHNTKSQSFDSHQQSNKPSLFYQYDLILFSRMKCRIYLV